MRPDPHSRLDRALYWFGVVTISILAFVAGFLLGRALW